MRATIVIALMMACGVVHAQDTGGGVLERAHMAWTRSEWDNAATLFKQALDEGGLSTKDALDAYVYLGSARSRIGKKDAALVAYRVAALIDKAFKLPSDAGTRAVRLAALAKRQEAKFGVLVLRPEMPATTPASEPFFVQVGMDPTHAAFLARVRVSVGDTTGTKNVVFEQPAASTVKFAIPASAAAPDAYLAVRVYGVDAHDNQVVTAEGHVQVQPAPPKREPVAAVPLKPPPQRSAALQPTPPPVKSEKSSGGGLFSSPWTYIIGGALLAGGAAGFYFATRPGDQVTVTNVHVQAIQ